MRGIRCIGKPAFSTVYKVWWGGEAACSAHRRVRHCTSSDHSGRWDWMVNSRGEQFGFPAWGVMGGRSGGPWKPSKLRCLWIERRQQKATEGEGLEQVWSSERLYCLWGGEWVQGNQVGGCCYPLQLFGISEWCAWGRNSTFKVLSVGLILNLHEKD